MSVKTVNYVPLGQDTGRLPSAGIWASCPVITSLADFGLGPQGWSLWDDFNSIASPSAAAAIGTLGQWATWMASGNDVLDAVEEGGVAKFNATTTAKSTILTSNAGSQRMVGPTAAFNYCGGKFWMEMRIALGSVSASQQGVFFGLCDNTSSQINSSDTTIIATGGNTLTTTKNLIGLFNRTTTSPADFSAVFQPAAGTAVYPTGLTTLVATVTGSSMSAYAASAAPKGQGTGFVKLGMVFDPTPQLPSLLVPATHPTGQTTGQIAKPVIQFFVNGVPAPAFLNGTIIQAATFPNDCVFSPVFNYINIAGSTAPVYLDWVRFAGMNTF